MSEIGDKKAIQSSLYALPYPLDAFPVLVRDAISEIHADSNIALEILGAAALGAMSLVCQGTTDVRVQANDPPSPCSLFLLTVAEPDSGKSYAMKLFNRAAAKFEEQRSKEIEQANATLPGRLAAWRAVEKKLTKELGRAELGTPEFDDRQRILVAHHKAMPVKLPEKQLILTKATSAGIREMLLKNNGNMGIFAPDAGNVINGPAFNEMQILSGVWSGEDVRDGLASGSLPLKDPRLTLLLMVQDSEFQKFMKNRGMAALGNGMLSRFMVMRAPQVDTTENNLLKEKINLLADRLHQLLSCATQSSTTREVLDFSGPAQTYWKEQRGDWRRTGQREGWSDGKRYFGSRLSWQMARIAALFHRVEGQEDGVISLDSVYGAKKLCDWYLSVFDDVLVSKVRRDVQKLREYAIRDYRERYFGEGDRFASTIFSNRSLIQYGPVRDSAALTAAMRVLLDEGDVIKVRSGPKGGDNYDFAPLLRGDGAPVSGRGSRSPSRVTSLGWDSD
ncbi:DUF3987 domain-containing protein [Burkholderia gladioli]|uniref:DUF3987 domain-containing protein n=1 Tax=Burkholderia gladioli TaxID=28095 RepID=UPI002FE0FA51